MAMILRAVFVVLVVALTGCSSPVADQPDVRPVQTSTPISTTPTAAAPSASPEEAPNDPPTGEPPAAQDQEDQDAARSSSPGSERVTVTERVTITIVDP